MLLANIYDYNHYYDSTATTTNVTEGSNSDETQTIDPEFTDAASGDFSVGNSDFYNTGFPGTFPGELTTGYATVGAYQVEAEVTESSTTTYADYQLNPTTYQLE